MKAIFVLFAALLAVFVSGMEDAPAQPLDADNLPSADNVEPRVTCDLVSGLGFNHALCAAHCIFKGYKGGYCDNKGVCNCRN